jgi:hypothetical protein
MQFISAISQPIFQVLGPKYSEMWFDLKGRTTATMVIAIGESSSSIFETSLQLRSASQPCRWRNWSIA